MFIGVRQTDPILSYCRYVGYAFRLGEEGIKTENRRRAIDASSTLSKGIVLYGKRIACEVNRRQRELRHFEGVSRPLQVPQP
jgi:hypothetical protein